MFVAIDIGNTATTIGYFRAHQLLGTLVIPSITPITPDKIGALILEQLKQWLNGDTNVEKIGISSVVPSLTSFYLEAVREYLKIEPHILNHRINLEFRILYDDPAQLGTDRLANVIAARALYGYPTLVIDLGTATKYDVIDKNGDYLGGLIAPGVWTGASSLFEKAAQLFPVKLEPPDRLIARNTGDSLKSGIYFGFLGQLFYVMERIKIEMGDSELRVVATGGYAELFRECAGLFNEIDAGLTLRGLEIAFNRKG
jgi:type III pantothenate kinase